MLKASIKIETFGDGSQGGLDSVAYNSVTVLAGAKMAFKDKTPAAENNSISSVGDPGAAAPNQVFIFM